MQSLSREIKGSVGGTLFAPRRIIRAVTNQGVSGMGRLHADLMFSTGLQLEPQLGDESFAIGDWILCDDFVMRDGFLSLAAWGFRAYRRKHMLTQFVPAQLQPLPPGACGRAWTALHIRHVLPFHGVRLQLFDEVVARGGVRGYAENAAGILVEPMDR